MATHPRTLPTVLSLSLSLAALPATGAAQAPIEVFHSTQSANLPTAETVPGGMWMFEISHRFLPAFSDGSETLWGLDGPVQRPSGTTGTRVAAGLQHHEAAEALTRGSRGPLARVEPQEVPRREARQEPEGNPQRVVAIH
ncbi:MAG TPA: DUF5777 family beta-barrel protein, partial [Longimicrobiales bacterium]|nr:DUF5777 family beta-barrel protein [Longimicrobiales bacterium]